MDIYDKNWTYKRWKRPIFTQNNIENNWKSSPYQISAVNFELEHNYFASKMAENNDIESVFL